MKDSWGPLKALVIASAVNGIGHVILCSFLRFGIEGAVGAAWATMASQVYMLNKHLLFGSIFNLFIYISFFCWLILPIPQLSDD